MHKGLSQTLRVVADLLRWEETGIFWGRWGVVGGGMANSKVVTKDFPFFFPRFAVYGSVISRKKSLRIVR